MYRFLLLLLVLVTAAACSDARPSLGTSRHALTTVAIAPESDGAAWGTTTQTIGQTFTVPAADSVLTTLVFRLAMDPAAAGFAGVRAYVYAWDVDHAVGPRLFRSALTPSTGAAAADYSFDVGALELAANATYVAFVSVVEDGVPDADVGPIQVGSGYAGGTLVTLANGGSAAAWTSGTWTAGGAKDLAMSATFVPRPATSTAVEASPSPSTRGQAVTLTATVTGAAPTGSVAFFDGGVLLGSSGLVNGKATLGAGPLAAGAHTFTAEYAGDLGNAPSASPVAAHTVNAAETTTGLTSAPNPAVVGATVTFRATVTVDAPGSGTPTGNVVFKEDGAVLGTVALVGNVATFTKSDLAIGGHSVVAEYVGDGNYLGSTSAPVSQTVTRDGSTLNLGSSANPSVYGGAVTFTAKVEAAGPTGVPTGFVVFMDGAALLGSIELAGDGTASVTTSALTGGVHEITAMYGGDVTHDTATDTLTQRVNEAPSTTVVTSATNPSVFGQSVTFVATITGPGSAKPTGTVVFRDGGSTIGTVNLDPGANQVSFSTKALSVATHTITAVYGGDANFQGSTSAALPQVVNAASTTTMLASSTNPSLVGGAVTFLANVAPVLPGEGDPGGVVSFFDGATLLGTGNLDGSGLATFATSALAAGAHMITASYSGSTSFAASVSAPVTQMVNQQGVSVTLSAAPNPSTFGAAVTFSAKVVSSEAPAPTGAVTFRADGAVIGTANLDGSGVARVTVSTLTGGSHTITATYAGDAAHTGGSAGSIIQVVNPAATSVAVTTTLTPSKFGQAITLTATVSSAIAGTRTGTLTFRDGATTLGVVAVAADKATLTTSALHAGTHPITAVYSGDTNYAGSTSPTLSQIVERSATTSTVLSSSNPSLASTIVTFTANVVANPPGAGTPGGTVTFRDGGSTLGTATLDAAGVATYSTAALGAGTHNITAVYGGNADFLGSTSSVLAQRVNTEAATISLVPNPATTTYGSVVTFRAALVGKAGQPTGSVVFKEGPATLGSNVLVGGNTTFATGGLSAGTHTITAAYSGDFVYANGTGAAIHVVDKAVTETTVSSSANPVPVGTPVVLTASIASTGAGFTGQVQFFDGDVSLGFGLVSGITATLEAGALGQGGHALKAVYSGDVNFAASTSAILVQDVTGAAGPSGPSTAEGPTSGGSGGDGGGCHAGGRAGHGGVAAVGGALLGALALVRRRRRAS